MKDTRIEAKTKLPYLQNFSTINKWIIDILSSLKLSHFYILDINYS